MARKDGSREGEKQDRQFPVVVDVAVLPVRRSEQCSLK